MQIYALEKIIHKVEWEIVFEGELGYDQKCEYGCGHVNEV